MYNNNPNDFSQRPPNHEIPRDIEMTPEEMAIYKDCNKDAFLKSGIPYGSLVACGTYVALKYGLLKPNAKYGYVPALVSAGLIGSIVGVASHKAMCLQKILELPNSALKQKIDARNRDIRNMNPSTMVLAPEEANIQTRAPMVSGLQMDNYQSPNDFDGFTGVNADGDQPPNFHYLEPLDKYTGGLPTTYDELRQKNRDDYHRSQTSSYRQTSTMGPNDTRYANPQAPISEGSNLPFDRDRAPQYQLND